MSSRGRSHHPLLLALCVLVGGALGYSMSAPPPEAIERPQGALPSRTTAAATPSATLHRQIERTAPLETAAAAAPPVAGFPPLPPPGPIRAHLEELRERARFGDRAAARRAHRDLHYCAQARTLLPFLQDEARKARARCVAERLCEGLQMADLGEAGSFLMRAAELGDPDAMAAVAIGQAINETAAGMRHLAATRALAPAYMHQALQAGSPIAMYSMVVGLCMKTDPVTTIPFHRDFPIEERLAWFHAIRPLLQNPQSRDSSQRCSEQWTPEVAARAEARGRALHVQHYAGRRDLPASAEAGWRRALSELGRFDLDGEDPRWADFPACAG